MYGVGLGADSPCETNATKLTDYESEEEAADCIRRSIARIADFSGKRPKGWVGASRQQNWSTLDVLVEEGCTYTFDWDNDDQPVPMQAKDGIVVSLPYGAGASDNQAFHTSKASPPEFEQMLKDGFDVLYRESEISGRVYTISLHSYIVGVPHRIKSLERALEYICRHDDVWLATGEEVTECFLSQRSGD
jgi:peptidoglycan/xylan/chitin deacetylase (PgdA/CDA1 family)